MLPIFKVVAVAPGERGNVKREFVPPSLLSLDVLVFCFSISRAPLQTKFGDGRRTAASDAPRVGGRGDEKRVAARGKRGIAIRDQQRCFCKTRCRARGRAPASPLLIPVARPIRRPRQITRPRPPAPALTCPVAYQMRNAVRRPKTVITVFGEDRLSLQRC